MHCRLRWVEWLFSSQFSLHYPTDLMITNMAWGWCPFLPGASLWKCRVLFHQVFHIPSISTNVVIFIRYRSSSDIDFWSTSHHDPHFATRWCVTFVFLHNGWFVVPVKVFHIAGCAIDQHCLRTDHPTNLSFAKFGSATQTGSPTQLLVVLDENHKKFLGVDYSNTINLCTWIGCLSNA